MVLLGVYFGCLIFRELDSKLEFKDLRNYCQKDKLYKKIEIR